MIGSFAMESLAAIAFEAATEAKSWSNSPTNTLGKSMGYAGCGQEEFKLELCLFSRSSAGCYYSNNL